MEFIHISSRVYRDTYKTTVVCWNSVGPHCNHDYRRAGMLSASGITNPTCFPLLPWTQPVTPSLYLEWNVFPSLGCLYFYLVILTLYSDSYLIDFLSKGVDPISIWGMCFFSAQFLGSLSWLLPHWFSSRLMLQVLYERAIHEPSQTAPSFLSHTSTKTFPQPVPFS